MANIILGTAFNMNKYRGLVKQLVTRDIKLKYRRSVLGYVWSVMNPLMTMIVLTIVFSTFFKFEIQNFPVYLLCGSVIFGYYSTATTGACSSIIENGSLIRKTYVPKYIFVFSKVTSAFVDFLFSLAALVFVMIFTHAKFSPINIMFIIPSLEIYIFSIGMGLLLSQANVFFRDVQYIYSVIVTALNYLTPLFYPIEILPEQVKFFVTHFNPLYLYVQQFRDCVYNSQMLDWNLVLSGFLWGVGAVVIGAFFFRKNQDKFILYI